MREPHDHEPLQLGFTVPGLTSEQDVRLAVIEKLSLRTPNKELVKSAVPVVDYILNGTTNEKDKDLDRKPNIIRKLPVILPGMDMASRGVQVYIKDDGNLEIEFRDEQHRVDLFRILAEVELISMNFSYIPAHPTNDLKDE